MKKLKIVGILAIACICIDLYTSYQTHLKDFVRGFVDGAQQAKAATTKGKTEDGFDYELEIRADIMVEGLTEANANVSMINEKIPFRLPVALGLSFFSFMTFVYVIGFCGIIKLTIDVLHGKVFTRTNVVIIRLFAYSSIGLSMAQLCLEAAVNDYVMSQLTIDGFRIISVQFSNIQYSMLAVMAILAESFAIGVNMKEEQDLTI